MSTFQGIPLGAVDFYEDLEQDNSREWWLANKPRYDDDVRAPLEALGALLEAEFGTPKLFRPNRDVRFSADKSPYKTHQGLVVAPVDGMGWYVQVSADGLMTAGGWWADRPELVARYREVFEDEDAGGELQDLLGALREAGYVVGGERLKSRPRGVDADHPHLELLRHRSLTATREYGEPEWLPTAELLEHVAADWRAYRPLMQWLAKRLGGKTV
ncbi:DUF2461 domain-containing protein [Tessaracoccus flavus]|uniref:TIGR02453 family protein n=1 Tax=Tessaracoccus flavus TaxID=1610493 RepID=A0A1Q2CEX8_9ACTN|nr:DUF2461 domain-containing protein [Tessaracoccus flavus]AQP44674.1 TIGR02453 family protein [Tessaracoccus flavus]